ncbi:Uncharacterised protein [Mycobacterium tuberculosis]|nr:Uncharacterised protein [Mycobacterium tuberculosis]
MTSSLRQAAVVKSGSQSTVAPAPRSSPANCSAAGPVGTTSAASPRKRTHPCGWVSAEHHTIAGTTAEDGQCGWTCSTCSTPFCSTATTVRSSHRRVSQGRAASF